MTLAEGTSVEARSQWGEQALGWRSLNTKATPSSGLAVKGRRVGIPRLWDQENCAVVFVCFKGGNSLEKGEENKSNARQSIDSR